MIEFIDVVKRFDTAVLDGFSMQIGEGELVLLRGASGSGKSTILSLIAAMSKPDSGLVVVNGESVAKLGDGYASEFRRKQIGFVFQKFNLIQSLSVFDNVSLPLLPLNLPLELFNEKVQKAMRLFHIEHKQNAVVKNLSGGEQQRVAIARAVVNEPKIILADEPTANLDRALADSFLEILKELKQEGKTIVVASHDPLFFGLSMVDREIVVDNHAEGLV